MAPQKMLRTYGAKYQPLVVCTPSHFGFSEWKNHDNCYCCLPVLVVGAIMKIKQTEKGCIQ
jgi:hypothetical protein